MNMKKQNYWKAVALKKDLFFRMKKSAHNINELIWKAKYESPIFIRVAFEAIKQLLLCGIIAFILFRADIFVDNKWEITINNNLKLPTCDSAKNVIRILALSAITAQK